MRLINATTWKLEDFHDSVPPYAILSHTWGRDEDELHFSDVVKGDLLPAHGNDSSSRTVKLEGCCARAKDDGLGYVWIDTCCINKSDSVELGEAINSMFRWYQQAAVCYAYLADVPPGDPWQESSSRFFSSRWFTRGWTLQELLAPPKLRFYDSSWTLLGTKGQMATAVQQITGIPRSFLLGWASLHEASIAQRMSWAAKRTTKRREDIAYCLLGIFGVMMPMIYGEGEQAFIRLQEAILRHNSDDSILAWGFEGDSQGSPENQQCEIKSRGPLATSPCAFAFSGNIVRKRIETSSPSLEIVGGLLRAEVIIHKTGSATCYGQLNCAQESSPPWKFVAIPLEISQQGGYVRSKGNRCAVFVDIPSKSEPESIFISLERQNPTAKAPKNSDYWFCIEEPTGVHLELIDVDPPKYWDKDRSMISTRHRPNLQEFQARFRHIGSTSRDFVIHLEFVQLNASVPEASIFLSTIPRTGAFPRPHGLSEFESYPSTTENGALTIENGVLEVTADLCLEDVAGRPMFVVRVAAKSISEVTEQRRRQLKSEYVWNVLENDKAERWQKELGERMVEINTSMSSTNHRLEEIEVAMKKLMEERARLAEQLEQETRQQATLDNELTMLGEQRSSCEAQLRKIPQELEELNAGVGSNTGWFRAVIKGLFEAGKLDKWMETDVCPAIDIPSKDGASDISEKNGAILVWAARHNCAGLLKRLIEDGADPNAPGFEEMTPLELAILVDSEVAVEQLLKVGAKPCPSPILEIENTPLWLAASKQKEGICRLLIKFGASTEITDQYGKRLLVSAVKKGEHLMVELLLKLGANLALRNRKGDKPLHMAVDKGDYNMCLVLLNGGANIDAKNDYGQTPLARAAVRGWPIIAQLLLQRGADETPADRDGRTALMHATHNDRAEIMRMIASRAAQRKTVPSATAS